MTLQPLYFAPGICKTSSPYSSGKVTEYGEGRVASGRYVDGNFIRFTAGFPEKLGGWQAVPDVGATTYGFGPYGSNDYQPGVVYGAIRAIVPWRANDASVRAAIGTDTNLYVFDGTSTRDITPLRQIAINTYYVSYGEQPYGTNVYCVPLLSVTKGSTLVVIQTLSATAQQVGDWLTIYNPEFVGGIQLDGSYLVTAINQTTGQITVDSLQTATATTVGGSYVEIGYTRIVATNPLSTTSGSSVVNVAVPNSSAIVGDQVIIAPSVQLNGLLIGGQYPVVTVVDANNFTIDATDGAGVPEVATWGEGPYGAAEYGATAAANATVYAQYGTGPYGQSTYQTGAGGTLGISFLVRLNPLAFTGAVPDIAPTTGWTIAAYGQQILANPIGGTIYVYDPTIGAGGKSIAFPLANAPPSVLFMFVTPERFVVALGIGDGGLEMAWADQNDYTAWISTATNTAESGRTLIGGSYFVGGCAVRDGVSLLWSNRTCFQMNYSGDSNVYDTPQVADNCGLIAPHAAVAEGEDAYWMSDKDFWSWTGTAQSLPSDDIRDYVFKNINTAAQSKCCAGMNRAKREVWFFYPTGTNTEPDSYVIYHIDQQCWSIGVLQRTAWADALLFTVPLAGDASGLVYYHETGVDNNGSAMDARILAAPIDLSNGDQNINAFGLIPDFERLTGNINFTVLTQYYPNDEAISDGPYVLTDVNNGASRLDLRSDGKMLGFMLESDVMGGDFRLGLSRADVQPSGSRR